MVADAGKKKTRGLALLPDRAYSPLAISIENGRTV
jgi:hypothetical protein